jgi:hypothetical protein
VILAEYGFDEPSGDTCVDYSGNGHDFSITGFDLARTTGHTYTGLHRTSGGTPAVVAEPAFGQTSDRTVMLWMKDPDNITQWVIRWDIDSLGSGGWGILLFGSTIVCQARNAGGLQRVAVTRPTDAQWHHYAATYKASTNTLAIYLDGSLQDSSTALTAPLRTDADRIDIAEFTSTTTTLDDVRIFDEALDSTGVNFYMNKPVGFSPTEATIGWSAQNATVQTSVTALAGVAAIGVASQDATTTVAPHAGAATFAFAGQNPSSSVAPPAGAAALGWAANSANAAISPHAGSATFVLTSNDAEVSDEQTLAGAATIGWASAAPSISISPHAGSASISWSAGAALSGSQSIACADFTTLVTVDSDFASCVLDAHSSEVEVDAHSGTAVICGRS